MTVLVPPPSVLRADLHAPLSQFVQAVFFLAQHELADGQEVPFVIDEHGAAAGLGAALYSYRPLYGSFLDERVERVRALPETVRALAHLAATPGAVEFARLHAGDTVSRDEALRSSILWPLAIKVAEHQDGFEFDEAAFEDIYGAVERGVVGTRHQFEAYAPLLGVLVTEPPAELGRGLSIVRAEPSDVARRWPDAQALLPLRFGVEQDRRCALELTLEIERGAEPPRLVALIAAAVRALRLVSGANVAAGPIAFERMDGLARPPVVPTPTVTANEPVDAYRFDSHLLMVARAVLLRLDALAPDDPRQLAVLRYESVVSADQARRAGGLRDAIGLALCAAGSPELAGLRAAAIAGTSVAERQQIAEIVAADAGDDALLAIIARHVLIAAVLDDQPSEEFAASADAVLLGARPRPQLVPSGVASLA